MPTFISPTGNPEKWLERPDGYFTRAEWAALEAEKEENFIVLRFKRDEKIRNIIWMRERHADELALGKQTTLTDEQHVMLLTYIQALRDLPVQPGAPWDGGGEETPWPELPEV